MRKQTKHLFLLGLAGIAALVALTQRVALGAGTPNLDKAKLEAYVRYIEGYTSAVKLSFDDPEPSAYKGYLRIAVHLSMGTQSVGDRVYYMSADGGQFFSGAPWNLSENPFLDTFEHLPSEGPSFGPANAKVTVVVFSDFQCPYCREFAKTMRDNLPKKYSDDVRVLFEQFPIASLHPWARAAAEAAQCLASQKSSAFWAFHDWIFDHQGDVNNAYQSQKATFANYLRDQTLAIAKEQNLDAENVASCVERHATAGAVEESVRTARALQIQQTPTEFINGRMISGAVPWKTLDAVIQLELNRPQEIPGPPAAKCCEVTIPTVLKK
ncbi:MAG: thioredoxin domain-containing protein [Acidobacteriaceae bacterium]|nr:thioredoxin domain-containing protein [Acidobacteriaceae bacterium]